MKLIRSTVIGVCALCTVLTGCGREDTVYLESVRERTETECETQSAGETQSVTDSLCYVYVCGAVKCPGVYALAENSRIYEAVDMAGGFREDARKEAVNQAGMVSDGQMVYIPSEEEAESGIAEEAGFFADGTAETADGRIDLNTATAEQLMTLPGIGESKAGSIIRYREEHGAFASVEDLMKVEGIKEGTYNRLKDSIKVN